MKGINSTAWFLPLIIFELRSSLLSLGRVQASWPLLLLTCSLVGCQTKNISEAQRFEASIRKELPFRIDSLRWFDGVDMATYQFANQDYVSTLPDAEIGLNGDVSVYQTFDFQKASRQTEDKVWRNVVVSKKNQRIICIDRYLKGGRASTNRDEITKILQKLKLCNIITTRGGCVSRRGSARPAGPQRRR